MCSSDLMDDGHMFDYDHCHRSAFIERKCNFRLALMYYKTFLFPLWDFLVSIEGTIHLEHKWNLAIQQTHDFFLMDAIINHTCQVFIGACSYDIILGQDFLWRIHFHINFDNNTMNCIDMSVHMQLSDFSLIVLAYAILCFLTM